ncbi:hypothetical protein ACU686_32805 [Yinghuangia aomiensis]
MSIRKVADRLGTAPMTIYTSFPGRDALVDALAAHLMSRHRHGSGRRVAARRTGARVDDPLPGRAGRDPAARVARRRGIGGAAPRRRRPVDRAAHRARPFPRRRGRHDPAVGVGGARVLRRRGGQPRGTDRPDGRTRCCGFRRASRGGRGVSRGLARRAGLRGRVRAHRGCACPGDRGLRGAA